MKKKYHIKYKRKLPTINEEKHRTCTQNIQKCPACHLTMVVFIFSLYTHAYIYY